jgi:hypothetical protein
MKAEGREGRTQLTQFSQTKTYVKNDKNRYMPSAGGSRFGAIYNKPLKMHSTTDQIQWCKGLVLMVWMYFLSTTLKK